MSVGAASSRISRRAKVANAGTATTSQVCSRPASEPRYASPEWVAFSSRSFIAS